MAEPQPGETADRDGRIGRILNDYLDRQARGEAETQGMLLARHPDLADELRSHLDLVGELKPQRATIEDLIAKGVLEACDDPGYAARLGEYRIRRFIGRGGMGLVLEGYDERLQRTVALKILRPELAEDQAALARFTREARAAAALRHPNIVTVHAVGHQDGAHYLAMEFIDGPTLADVIATGWPVGTDGDPPVTNRCHMERGPLPTELIRDIFGQLLSALAAAHEAGLIHRDVKSSNILLDCGLGIADCGLQNRIASDCEQGTATLNSPLATLNSPTGRSESAIRNPKSAMVKLADFGLARMLSAKTRMTLTGSVLGTPEYMSPEQARGDENLDHRTDLYSAGVVLYEMLTGRVPFRADTATAVIHRIIHEDPPEPRAVNPDADAGLASLARRLMAKRPEDRLESASDTLAVLGVGERVPLRHRRRKFRSNLIAGMCGLLALCGGVWLLGRIGRPAPISDVQLDPESHRSVQVRYGNETSWTQFYDFPADRQGYFLGTAVVGADGKGRQIVAVGARKPLDDVGNTLIALNESGNELWRKSMHTEWDWPGIKPGQDYWHVQHVLAGELDGVPGDELVVVAQDQDYYPTCVSLIDPLSGAISSSYWHFGQIEAIEMIPGYFKDGRPTLMARGCSNKLDGFADESVEDSEPLAHWDVVSVLMILDPKEMDGVGPPPTDHLPVPAGNPYAYAFLDRPRHRGALEVTVLGGVRRATPAASLAPHETAYIESVVLESRNVQDGTGPWLRVNTMYSRESGPPDSHRPLIVDRNLNLREMAPTPPHLQNERVTKEYWNQYWHPIVQNGQYVRE